jgi:uncharacterized protein (DUF2252 family)
MALRDARERQSSAAPHAMFGERFERVRGTRWMETAGATGKRRKKQLIRAHGHERGANAGRD